MMRIVFSLMDSDGDGTISLQEFQAAHERIFKAMDANKDGRLTLGPRAADAMARAIGRAPSMRMASPSLTPGRASCILCVPKT
jgi:Ca2+-binding EF-hand superfamily protein